MNSSRSKYADNRKVKNVRIVNPGASPDPGSGSAKDAVKYTEQSLTEAQKSQARTNIGAAYMGDVIQNASDIAAERARAITAEGDLQQMIAAIQGVSFVVVESLPPASADTAGGKIYLVPSAHSEVQNAKDEYITIASNGSYSWEHIGSTTVDMEGVLMYSEQALSAAEKEQARTNIGAAALAAVNAALTALESAIAAKYSKPAAGIPETDLDASVQAALALARTAVQSLSDYYTREQVDDITAAIAASVGSTSGVVVTTLPTAAAGTLGKIYYVGPDASGFYDRYVTSYDGSSYSWLALGNTEVDMAQYATVEQVSDKTIAPLHVDGNRTLIGEDGSLSENANINVVVATFSVKGGTDYAISGRVPGGATGVCLYAWYDADDVFISSGGTSAGEYSSLRVTSPNNAAFIRVSQNRQAALYPSAAQVIEIADVAKRLEGYDIIEKSLYQPGRIFSYVSRPLDIEITTGKYYTATPAFSPSANYQCSAIKVNAGERLIITAYHLSNSGPGAMLVNSGTGEKQIIIYTGSTAKAICGEVVIPSGYDWLYLNGHTNHPISVVRIERIVRSVLPTDEVQTLNYEYQREMIIDARPSSESFGQPIMATNRDWAISQYIDLLDIRHIRLYRNITSASDSYAKIGGLVFYDDNLIPLSDGAETLYKGSIAVSNFSDMAVPVGARYLRVSVSINMPDAAIELYPAGAPDIPIDLNNKFEYEGERISFHHRFAREVYASQGAGAQSAAIWGDYLFFIYDKLSAVHVFNIKSRIRIATITPDVEAGENWHCNQSNFDTRKYDDSDVFPILWTSFQNDENGRCIWAGLRILTTSDAGGAITSFDVAIVQKIYLPVMTDANCLGNANIAVDQENGFFWAYSYNKDSSAANYREARLTKFAIPALFDGGGTIIPEVYLTDADMLDGFFPGYTGDYSQGGFIKRGKLVIAQGMASYSTKPCLRVIDLVAKNVASFVDLNAAGYTEEPQGVFFYDGHVFYTTGTKDQYYRLFFD